MIEYLDLDFLLLLLPWSLGDSCGRESHVYYFAQLTYLTYLTLYLACPANYLHHLRLTGVTFIGVSWDYWLRIIKLWYCSYSCWQTGLSGIRRI